MYFTSLKADGFRNLKSVDLSFSEQFMFFLGENGSGKTSVLEALYFLSHAKSFRVSNLKKLISNSADEFSLFSCLGSDAGTSKIGVSRSSSGRQKIKYNGDVLSGIASVSKDVPVQFLDTDAHRCFADAPSNRRKFLDWGVFHVEHSYSRSWQSYQKVLRQRNAMLKFGSSEDEMSAWTSQLAELGDVITENRSAYVNGFIDVFNSVWGELMPSMELPQIEFSKGWVGDNLLGSLLSCSEQDRRFGYTTCGPHRCDLKIFTDGTEVFDYYSQGQQKALTYALKVAQGIYLKKLTGREVVYLIDDLPAELDNIRLSSVLELLANHASQVFITAIEKKDSFDFVGQGSACFDVADGFVKSI